MPRNISKTGFIIRYILNIVRTWFLFNVRYPWVKYKGFVRVMPHTRFARRKITIGNRVQFGKYCSIASDVTFKDNILIASRVGFMGRNDHSTDKPRQYIWDGKRARDGITVVGEDVWIGYNSTILAGVQIGEGAIIAACSLVNKDVPPCEIWGGVPAKKIRDRFVSEKEREEHLLFLKKNNALHPNT